MTKQEAIQEAKKHGCKNILKISTGKKDYYSPCFITTNKNRMMLASWLKHDKSGFTPYFHRVRRHNVIRINQSD
jgi:hypothetical protein